MVDGQERPIAFVVIPGQLGDGRGATELLGPLPPARVCMADCAYDSHGFRSFLESRGARTFQLTFNRISICNQLTTC